VFVEPGVALRPGGAGESVAFCGGAEEYFAAVARVARAYGVADSGEAVHGLAHGGGRDPIALAEFGEGVRSVLVKAGGHGECRVSEAALGRSLRNRRWRLPTAERSCPPRSASSPSAGCFSVASFSKLFSIPNNLYT
jgi:hypothetical protein